jgi:hypothetical protein
LTVAKKPAKALDLSALKAEFLNALDQLVSDGGDYAYAAVEKLHEVIDRMRNRPEAMKAGKPLKCGPGGEGDHAECACCLVDSAAETFALALHMHCLCCEDGGA